MSAGLRAAAPGSALLADRLRVAVWLGWAVLLVGAAVLALDTHAESQAFLTWLNVRAILTASAYVGVFAVATTVIMISGSLFSLSLGITGAIAATTFLAMLDQGIVMAIGATLALGILVIGAQGLLIGFLGANPIIVTIAAGGVQTGVFLWVTGGATTVPPPGNTSFQWLNNRYFELPLAVYVLFALVLVLEFVMRRTRFGRLVYLVGENRRAAYAAGLPVGLVVAGAFAVAGVCVAIVGIELGAFNQSGSLLVESTFTYDGIAAAVVGGTAITGGRGSMVRALAGALFIATVSNMVLLRGYDEGWQILVKGLIVFVVVALVQLNRRRTAA